MKETAIIVLLFVAAFSIHLLNAERSVETNDLNKDGEITLADFSIALDRVNNIQAELRNQNHPANVIKDVYPDVPHYSPNK